MHGRLVTIKGTWRRASTDRSEVDQFRDLLAKSGLDATFTVRRSMSEPGRGAKGGTFEATVFVPTASSFVHPYNSRLAAKHALQSVLYGLACRAPTLRSVTFVHNTRLRVEATLS